MNRFHFHWKCGREEGMEQIERGKVIEWEKKLREEAKNGGAGEARHWGRACLYCWEEKGILDTNYSCADATPHLMRRVRSYLKDDIKAETEEKKRCEPSRVVCNRGAVIIRYGIWHYIWGALLLQRWSVMKKEKKTKCIQSTSDHFTAVWTICHGGKSRADTVLEETMRAAETRSCRLSETCVTSWLSACLLASNKSQPIALHRLSAHFITFRLSCFSSKH